MPDLISRQDAIALFDGDETNDPHYKVPVPVIIQNLKDLPAVDNASNALDVLDMRWIPVSERLPEEYMQVILSIGAHTLAGYYAGYNGVHRIWRAESAVFWDNEVTAWQPLPEPYKEARE